MSTERDRRPRRRSVRGDDVKPLPDRSEGEADAAWGDEPGARDDDWYRRERPPHHE